jgi:hypothetical protein
VRNRNDTPEIGDEIDGQSQGLLRRREGLLDPAMAQHLTAKIDQDPVEGAAADLDPDGVSAVAVDRQERRRLTAGAGAPSIDADQLPLLEIADDEPDRVVGKVGVARKLSLGRLSEAPQGCQDHALVELTQIG